MPTQTITEELELLDTSGGTGGPGGEDGGDGGEHGGKPETPRSAYFTGLSVGLAGILMFFMALVSAFIVRKGIGGDWRAVVLPKILWLNTAVLAASSVTVEIARRHLARAWYLSFRRWWAITTSLGVAFLFGQVLAWRELWFQGVFVATNPSHSFFYVLTAAHGLHLLGGMTALLYVALRNWQERRRRQMLAADLTAVYWHFMDGLWVFLLLLLYLGR